MNSTLTHLLSAAGPLGIAIALLVIGLLSKRMNSMSPVSNGKPLYRWYYVAALLAALSAAARILGLLSGDPMIESDRAELLWVLLYHGLPALAVTIGVVAAWRYWSWLLAERD
ncbi:MAG: hypothetical protein KC547_06980 [Anaerolineae bacterium]|nr:hypothetical protein [Anaerolineae bacterium]MCA9908475.1 hypothetical protein [Anaerolineae bacterium]